MSARARASSPDFLGSRNFLAGAGARRRCREALRSRPAGTLFAQALPLDGAGAALRRPGAAFPAAGEDRGAGRWRGGDTVVKGEIAAWSYLGADFALDVRTRDLGTLRVALPAWRAPIAPAEGLAVRLGWTADAAVPVEEDAAA
jgi:putative spermidine/putrescine transport system ATP-binding protein